MMTRRQCLQAAAAVLPPSTMAATERLRGPRLAVVDYSKVDGAARRRELARYDIVILGLWPSLPAAYQREVVQTIRSANPQVQVAQYSILSEYRRNADAEVVEAIDRHDWWLRNAEAQHVQWTDAYGNWEVNVTDWAPRDEQGRSWPQWKADYDRRRLLEPGGPYDWIFADTVMDQRVRADWKRRGRDQDWNEGAVSAAVRRGFAQHWGSLRDQVPGLRIMANASPEFLSSPELSKKAEGAFLEGMLGKSYSPGRHPDGFKRMWTRYRDALANTAAPHAVVFQVYGEADDYQRMRYGLATTLLADGYFAYNGRSLQQPMPWFDEYDVPLGRAVDPPPSGPGPDGLWLRRYEGGLVFVNPGPLPLRTTLQSGYRRPEGVLTPALNNGNPLDVVTVPPADGCILLLPIGTSPRG